MKQQQEGVGARSTSGQMGARRRKSETQNNSGRGLNSGERRYDTQSSAEGVLKILVANRLAKV